MTNDCQCYSHRVTGQRSYKTNVLCSWCSLQLVEMALERVIFLQVNTYALCIRLPPCLYEIQGVKDSGYFFFIYRY